MPIKAFSYEVNVHEKITENAINTSTIGQYLNNNLDISLNDSFNGNTAKKWLELGSKWEDDDLTMRWLNHFYDPTTGKGLNSSGITWGQPSLQWGKDSTENEWDWAVARLDYYRALTSTNSSDRDKFFADVFRGLGQIIHLIEDIAVVAHTRNDPHPYIFENYLQQQRDMYEKYTRDAVNDELNGTNKFTPLKYDGYSAVDLTTFNTFDTFWINSGKGLAEYTNSNFLSRDTNIDDNKYSSPVGIGEWVATEKAYDPDYGWIYVDVKYLQGYATDNYRTGQSSPISRLSALSYFDYEMQKYNLNQKVYSLNDYVHKEYADLLIPRAVGYSAGLLDYFFRGEIEAVNPEATKDSSGRITGVKLKVKNNTSNEAMGTGKFVVSYQYKPSGSSDFVYGTSYEVLLNESIASGSESTSEFTFNFTSSIPSNAQETKYYLIYRGKLGNEDDAVVGKTVEIKEKEYLFLVNLSNQQAAFEIAIKNNNYELIPVEDFSIQMDYISGSYNMTMQSTPDNTQHILSYPNYCSYTDYLLQYGVTQPSTYCRYGASVIFRPLSFTADSPYGKDYFYERLYQKDGNYQLYALGRHNYTLDNDGRMTTYADSIWKDTATGCSSNYIYRYKTEQSGGTYSNGEAVAVDQAGEGTSLYIPGQGWTYCSGSSISNEVIAAMGNGKAINIIKERTSPVDVLISEIQEIPWNSTTETFVYSWYGAWVKIVFKYHGTLSLLLKKYEKTSDGAIILQVGNENIDSIEITEKSQRNENSPSSDWYQDNAGEATTVSGPGANGNYGTPETADVNYSNESYNREGNITINDYDNKNGTDMYVMFYTKNTNEETSISNTSEKIKLNYNTLNNAYYMHHNYYSIEDSNKNITSSTTKTDQYFLGYKTPALGFKKILLVEDITTQTQVNNIYTIYNDDGTTSVSNSSLTSGDLTHDIILTGFSCQLNKEIMVYTYILKKWNGSEYVFDKRVVGIINISDGMLPVGYKQEFEITNTSFPTMNFDFTQVGVIGIHKIQ